MSSSISSSDPEAKFGGGGGALGFLGAASLTVVVIVVAAWMLTAYYRQGFLPMEYGSWVAKQRFLAHCDLAPNIVMGDSRAVAGFIPDLIPGTVNLADGGDTPMEMYFEARRILACAPLPRRVIMSESILMLVSDPYFWRRNGLFGGFRFADLEAVRKRSRQIDDTILFAKPAMADLDAIMTNWLYANKFPSFYSDYILDGGVIGRRSDNLRVERQVERARGYHAYGDDPGVHQVAEDAGVTAFRPSPLLDSYFNDLLTAFGKAGVEVVFIGVPMNDATYRRLAPGIAADMTAYLQRLAASHGNFTILGEPVDHLDDGYFGDANHLNPVGARLFSPRRRRKTRSA